MFRAVFALCFALLLPGLKAWAHTVPSMVVEAEFTPAREVTLLVNLDPRLFLSEQPTALPPVPASWWFQQNEAERAEALAKAAAYVDAQLQFRVGGQELHGAWKVQPVDSATVAPVAPSSAEVHLLVEHRGPLPEVAGDFKVSVARTCAVATLLINVMEGAEQRQPQAVFPGESSRGFVLPPLKSEAAATQNSPTPASGAPGAANADATRDGKKTADSHTGRPRHSLPAHVLFAVAVTFVLLGRFWGAATVLLVFHLAALFTLWMTWQGWLPVSVGNIPRNSWMTLGGTALSFLLVRRIPPALLGMAAFAGFLHGWGPWNLRVWQGVEQPLGGLFKLEGLRLLLELVTVALAVPCVRYLVEKTNFGRYFSTGEG